MPSKTYMRAIVKSGNQFTITIPRPVVDAMRLMPKEDVNVIYNDITNEITIRKTGGLADD